MNRFLAELSRRNVFRVAAAYVIVGWIVLQVGTLMFGNFGAPDWVAKVFTSVIILGFPIAMLLTWAFELTPQGVRKIEPGDEAAGASLKLLDLGLLVIAALIVVVTVLRPVGTPGELAETNVSTAEAPEASIAVLAFANMSGDPENEYFSDGISEEILNALAGIKSMRVAARTSAFSFKGRNEDIRVIGEALDVANVLEGSVRRSGDRVRVTAQLINVADGYHLWSETYDRDLTDIFVVQEEIALAITQALKIELNIEEKGAISRQGTDNVEAYSAYLKGRELRADTSLIVAAEANGFFKKAVELDPGFSDAWGALAVGYALASTFLPLSALEEDLVEAYATALRLNPEEPGALAAKAFYTVLTTHDWREAGALYRRALDADRSGLATNLYITDYLYMLGRNREAVALTREIIRRDPLNNALRRQSAFFNSFAGSDNEFALEQLNLLIAAGEDATMMFCLKASVLALLNRDTEALESLARAGATENQWDLANCAQANYYLGHLDQFNALFAELKAGTSDQYGHDMAVATMYSVVGDFEPWLEMMNTFLANGEFGPNNARTSQANFGGHVSDPRYQALLKAVRLDDASLAEMGMVWGEPRGEQGVAE